MKTDLFAVVSRIDPASVARAIPPDCRRDVEPAPSAVRAGTDTLVECGPWRPRGRTQHLLAAFSALSTIDYSVRFELSVFAGGAWSPWVGTVTVGSASFAPLAAEAPGLRADVDVFTVAAPAEQVRVRLRLRADDPASLLVAPWLLTLSACDLVPAEPIVVASAASVRLAVPALSQTREGGALGARVCSPTSVAMVLAYLGGPDSVARLAAEMFHPALDIYGVWPAAICAAGRRGVLGYLLRFPDWAGARWCLDRGLPIIASVRYAAGELSGAAVAETPGHLLVLTGYEGEDVLVNDPAAPDTATVPRRYRQAQLARVWLERAGVGYVLFRA
ncbi:MAG TPA: C39 family peptidase [Methylomirabilota bacterium]|nr:C39 family peptidase [Methylomirabilota bacterium]